jgi:hypothetical protein
MKLRVSFILLAIVFVGSSFQSQKDAGETVNWQAGSKLIWKDFKKQLKDGGLEAAYTVCGISISSNESQMDDKTVTVNVHSFFSRTLSAKTINSAHLNNVLLRHEQDHFDMAELYTRKLRKDIMDAHFKSIPTFYKNLQVLYNKENAALVAEQSKYDKETNHSLNATEQEKWNGAIADALSKYSDYANAMVKVVIGN